MKNDIDNKPKEKDNDNKHMIFLAIVAMSTLIIVVVGATFAYLANMRDTVKNSAIKATTEGGDSVFLINAGDNLAITADTNTLNESLAGNTLTDDTISTVALSSSSATSVKYAINVLVDTNNFTYSSGECYRLADNSTTSINTKDACTDSKIWIPDEDGTSGKCYANLTQPWDEDSEPTNRLSCVIDSRNVWKKVNTPELTISLYKNDTTCATAGVCVNADLSINTDYTTIDTCTAAEGTWVPKVEKDGICYILNKKIDVTEAVAGDPLDDTYTGINLIPEATVSVDGTTKTATDYYYTVLGFENFEFNQIENGNKEFTGRLIFTVVD